MKYIILISLLLNGYLTKAQSIEKQVLGSTGNTSITSSLIVTSTIGEANVQTQSASTIILSAGYQQAIDNATSVSKVENALGLTLYPNPSQGISNLEVTFKINSNVQVKVYSSLGVEISTSPLQLTSGLKATAQINLTNQANGVYYVHVLDEQNQNMQTFKLLKL